MTVANDLPCVRCGYNLRALQVDAVCPECGLAIGHSSNADTLHAASAGWIASQQTGLWILFFSYLLCGVAVAAEMYRLFMPWMPDWGMAILRVVPFLSVTVAAWLLTRARRFQLQPTWSSWSTRRAFIAVLAMSALLPVLDRYVTVPGLMRAGWTVFFVLLVACWVGLGAIQVRIATQIRQRWLALLAVIATGAWCVGLAWTGGFYVFREFTDRSLFDRAAPGYVYTLVAGGGLLLTSALLMAIAFTMRVRIDRHQLRDNA